MTMRTFAAGTMSALVLGVGAVTLGGCAKPAAPSGPEPAAAQQWGADSDTVDLVDAALDASPATAQNAGQNSGRNTAQGNGRRAGDLDRPGLRARLLRALHATWVTQGPTGTVTHQAIRGEVTAVSGTSVTVKAKDGFTLTFTVSADTRVRARAAGKGSDSTIGAVKVGTRALVTGVGAANPSARLVVFHSGTPRPSSSPSPSATS